MASAGAPMSVLDDAIAGIVDIYSPDNGEMRDALVAKGRYDELMRKGEWQKRLNAGDKKTLVDLENLSQRMATQFGPRFATELDARQTTKMIAEKAGDGAPIWGNRSKNLRSIRALRDQVAKVRAVLRDAPGVALLAVFATKTDAAGDEIPSETEQTKSLARLKLFASSLDVVHRRCLDLAERPPGMRQNAGYLEIVVCDETWQFMQRHRKTPTNSPTSLFRRTAELFHQAVTGEEKSYEHPCRETFKRKPPPQEFDESDLGVQHKGRSL